MLLFLHIPPLWVVCRRVRKQTSSAVFSLEDVSLCYELYLCHETKSVTEGQKDSRKDRTSAFSSGAFSPPHPSAGTEGLLPLRGPEQSGVSHPSSRGRAPQQRTRLWPKPEKREGRGRASWQGPADGQPAEGKKDQIGRRIKKITEADKRRRTLQGVTTAEPRRSLFKSCM